MLFPCALPGGLPRAAGHLGGGSVAPQIAAPLPQGCCAGVALSRHKGNKGQPRQPAIQPVFVGRGHWGVLASHQRLPPPCPSVPSMGILRRKPLALGAAILPQLAPPRQLKNLPPLACSSHFAYMVVLPGAGVWANIFFLSEGWYGRGAMCGIFGKPLKRGYQTCMGHGGVDPLKKKFFRAECGRVRGCRPISNRLACIWA